MRKIIFILLSLFLVFTCFAQDANPVEVEEQVAATDPFAFEKSTVTAGHATIDFAFNEMTGVLRVTYTLKDFAFDRADANTAIRDAVDVFARDHGYFKARLYPDEDDCAFFAQKNTYRYKRFYILHDKSRI